MFVFWVRGVAYPWLIFFFSTNLIYFCLFILLKPLHLMGSIHLRYPTFTTVVPLVRYPTTMGYHFGKPYYRSILFRPPTILRPTYIPVGPLKPWPLPRDGRPYPVARTARGAAASTRRAPDQPNTRQEEHTHIKYNNHMLGGLKNEHQADSITRDRDSTKTDKTDKPAHCPHFKRQILLGTKNKIRWVRAISSNVPPPPPFPLVVSNKNAQAMQFNF